MRAVFQRVKSAFVEADGIRAGEIGEGAVLFLGIEPQDGIAQVEKMAAKVAELRVFTDEQNKMNRSVVDVGGGVLIIPNFTLCASCMHGRRPDFMGAARPELARPLFDAFVQSAGRMGIPLVQSGVFGADMRVMVENDGPVTLLLNTADWKC